MTTILVLRALGLGDTYAAVPALRALRRGAEGARIVFAGPSAWGTLLLEQGVVDGLEPATSLEPLSPDLPVPDVAVNLHGSGPESHRVLAEVRPGRIVAFASPAAGFTDGPLWDPAEHEVRRWTRLASELGGRASPDDLRLDPPSGSPPHPGAVVVHPGAAFGSRRWPVGRWREVAAALARAGLPVVVTGTSDERDLTRTVSEAAPTVVDLGGRLTPRELAQLVGAARLVLSTDTGIAHVATASGTASVTLFGPTDPALWGPLVDLQLHEVIWAVEPGDPVGEPRGSRLDPRLERVDAAELLARAEALLMRSRGRPA
jgi:ADP-heptose:LPS heptosyltransferase